MNNDNRIQGIWWLSDKPNEQVPGDLLISERKLELNGSFEGIKNGYYGGGPRIISIQQGKTILGVSKKGGKKYTLEYFDIPTSSISFPGYKADTYRIGTIFEGDHFIQTKSLSFHKYYIEFPYLFEWVGEAVVSIQIKLRNQKKCPINDITIKVSDAKTIDIFENKQFKLSLFLKPGRVPLMATKEFRISQQCLLKVESKVRNLDLSDLYSIVLHFKRFLIIAVGKSLKPISLQGVVGAEDKTNVINLFPYFLGQKEYCELHPSEMNFTLSDIKNMTQVVFDKWFSDKDKHTDTFDLFSAISSDSNKNLHNQYKDIVSTIEGYVRIEKNNLNISLERAIKTLNEEIPKDSRPIPKSDYKKIRITRNKLSHIAIKKTDEKFVLGYEEKWANFHKLLFILEYALLKNLGMSDEFMDKFYIKRKSWLNKSSQ